MKAENVWVVQQLTRRGWRPTRNMEPVKRDAASDCAAMREEDPKHKYRVQEYAPVKLYPSKEED